MYVIDHECVMDVYYEYVVYLDLESRAGQKNNNFQPGKNNTGGSGVETTCNASALQTVLQRTPAILKYWRRFFLRNRLRWKLSQAVLESPPIVGVLAAVAQRRNWKPLEGCVGEPPLMPCSIVVSAFEWSSSASPLFTVINPTFVPQYESPLDQVWRICVVLVKLLKLPQSKHGKDSHLSFIFNLSCSTFLKTAGTPSMYLSLAWLTMCIHHRSSYNKTRVN